MFTIKEKKELAENITQLTIEAPAIARKAKAGQFVAVVVDEKGERIPLTLADWDNAKGTITLILQKVGYTTNKLGALNVGDPLAHILGPLGHPTKAEKIGSVICIGGGVGIAEMLPVSRAFKQAGNRVIGIIGARSKDLLILEKEMLKYCDELFITTDDGSYEKKGFVLDPLRELLTTIEKSTHTHYPELVYCIGPIPMMQAVSNLTKEHQVKTIVSLNPIMVDATGMCGACRCNVGGKTVFGCVDGPDFDGHKVDFEELRTRLNMFRTQEEEARRK